MANLGDTVGDEDNIEVDGEKVKPGALRYLAYYKPVGVIATKSDEHDRETIYSTGEVDKSLSYAGRLDMGSEGLMILTNDGNFIERLSHPSVEIEKVYQLTLSGSPENLKKVPERFLSGLNIDGKLMRADKVVRERSNVFKITLHQGYNRQLRKMSVELNLGVISLKRIQIGRLKLGDLKPGEIKSIDKNMVM